jgi:hypothetical protein
MPRPAEHRMIGNPVLDAKLAKPPIRQIDPDLRAQPPLRADRKYVTYDQHPDHQFRIDRGAARVRVVRRKLPVHPTKIDDAINLTDQMVGWNYLIEIKGIEKLPLPNFPPPHHVLLPMMTDTTKQNHGSQIVSIGVLQHIHPGSGL